MNATMNQPSVLSKQTGTVQHFQPDQLGDWDLVCALCAPGYRVLNLSSQGRNALYLSVYAHNDGYGIPGLIPPQGYDWSGIRDSTEFAQQLMAQTLRRELKIRNINLLTIQRMY